MAPIKIVSMLTCFALQFAFKYDNGEDKYQILVEGKSVFEKDGKLCLAQPDGDACNKWVFVPVDDGYV